MSTPALDPTVIRFGVFELDLQSRELRKSGLRIKLQDQPFQILAMLLERPGEVITREDLQKRLWPGDTFVDFDLSLNSAVKKLRQALGDDSDNPRFIETLYRRGYRFIGPVSGVSVPRRPVGPQLAEPAAESTPREAAPALQPKSPSVWGLRRILFYCAVVAAVLLATLFYTFLKPPARPRVLGYTQITHDGRLKGDMVTDGQRLYLSDVEGDHFGLSQVSVSGGEAATLQTSFTDATLFDMAPDGSALLVGAWQGTVGERTLWILPLPTGSPRRVGDLLVESAAWSPDGKQIAFSKGSEIYVADADGHQVRKLSAIDGSAVELRFASDNSRLRFVVIDLKTGSSALWEVKTDGSNLHPLLPGWNDPPQECCGNWTPDGRYFLFQSFRNGRNDIWALPEVRSWMTRSEPVQITNGPLSFSTPAVSKDGKKIFTVGQQQRAELQRYDLKSGSFAPLLGGLSATDLVFSPDGQWVSYVSVPDDSLWRSKIDGSERLQLTSSDMWTALPRWSPDGKQIVFMGRTVRTDWRAYLVSSAGGEARDLVPGADAGYDPGWSADGKSVALSVHDAGATSRGISILDLQKQKLFALPGSDGVFSPRWSPDGRYIAALSTDSQKLMLFDLPSQKWTELADTLVVGFPTWSHDSQYIYFDTTFTLDPALFRVRIADHHLERLVSLRNVRRFWGVFDSSWTGLTPDDSPIIVRDTGTQEIYAIDWLIR